MSVVKGGPAPYVYVCTRMRVRKSKLLPREEYLRMLNMSLPQITRLIEEMEYKKEIDELAASFSGIDLVEEALSWNLAKEFQKILEITPGILKQFTQSYLRGWDIQNALTIIRGKNQGMSAGKIKEVLVPAGTLDVQFLDKMIAEDSLDRAIEMLKGQPLYPVVEREYPKALEQGSFGRLENELYRQFYADLIEEASGGLKGGKDFLKSIQLDIDIRNIKTLFRLRPHPVPAEETPEVWIPGASFTVDELKQLSQEDDINEVVDTLRKKVSSSALVLALEGLREEKAIHEVENSLTRAKLDYLDRLSKRNPFSIYPILVYLEKKKYEVINLRALARGKQANLPADRIENYLVI
ncbi:MAG: ATP synthase A1 subunit C [Methanocalculus sp. MSAO_Arc1]|uniref:V-type ATP synthase subunit C n=1 Tax=Methanocalculus TaxID=71151 RepID=UPI000FEFFB24|nr:MULTISPECIES: V-type ATP synthase subunit C [unclassified Methanocalculus]MCP1661376.1 V/A-type H+-transporting ATPase subunit C [Methanocalculus sp. AMF5]RQD79668.1 MAG: ATP synthase A1 subunit C [Methanocalculus sp. MSAO_Arc1]